MCGQCERLIDELVCPGSLSENRFTVKLGDVKGLPHSSFHLKCRHNAQAVNFSLIADCNFASVKYVHFQWCPLPNVSFSEVFEQISINPENVTSLSFTNIGQRNDELQDWHLDKLRNLITLEFRDNVFRYVPPNIFSNTPNLRHLVFTANEMETLPVSLFSSTPNLTKVELYNNGFTNLPDGLFANLSNLGNISLWDNNLSEIKPELLSGVPKLWSLELTHNNISQLDPNVFVGLTELRKCLIGSNKIKELPESIFHSCPQLEILKFDNNKIAYLPDDLLKEANIMKRLEFSYNQITQIPPKLFANTKNLENLKLKRTRITTLPPKLFEGLTKLEVLDLQSNTIETLPSGIFDDLIKVDTLILHNNTLRELPDEIFKNCTSLIKLYLSHNKLSTLLDTMFPNPSVITKLDLSHNNISFSSSSVELLHGPQHITVQEYFPLVHQSWLRELSLKNNKITEMPQAMTSNLKNLTKLDLNSNLLNYLDQNDLAFQSDSIEIDLRNNQIRIINLNSMNYSFSKRKVDIYVEGNPLVCNCELYAFAKIVQENVNRKPGDAFGIRVRDVVNCAYPMTPDVFSQVSEIDTKSLMCKLQECVGNCTCSTRAYDDMFIVDCAYQGLHSIPKLERVHIPDDKNYSLTLILRNNSITSLKGLNDEEYEGLVNLTLPYNKLDYINETDLPETLKALDIRGNNITTLPASIMEFLNSSGVSLSLGNNPWICDCDIVKLHSFLRDPNRPITDIHNVKCSAFEDEALINLTEEDLCPVIQQPLVIVSIAAIAVFLLLFAILGTVSLYKYKQDIKVWLFTHRLCLWAVAEEEHDADKKYDAFISYSDKDEKFVNTVLVPGLESGDPKYKVCLHYRDWVPGEYIQNQIDQSVEASRRTIVVLSSNFIENVWGHIEFKTAHSKALKDRTNRIIVVVLGEVPPDNELDEELKLYLSTRTYLQWRDVKFWEKLRYAMPHPSDLISKRHKKQSEIEKHELAKTHSKTSV